ncbi:hypothetical protein BJY14_002576 [Actinomadura luteofluorescens]|uniref:Schlafen AlbA-2 domain-containing protein n=1 Tax=Actinomadura luteofluorescens TaxID=46163 RepID=A0A7Y9EF74_9ACTN|nr:ATP-binding protein [Actinomadura luteofluorescens]NYD46593.1 hypothetical protein [Actinomadura luteofluorescens]
MAGVALRAVPFPIEDLSRPFRRPSELRRLVEAVRAADDKDESLWVEWKSTLDLTSQPGLLHLVRQILGFANRDPEVAAQWCEGNAYLLVGVSPGQLQGVAGVDPQRLVQTLQPYLGSEITWTPEYVTVEGREVLVVEIGPPKPGDPIRFLLKDLFITKKTQTADGPKDKRHGYHHGTILIRRPGDTERADQHEREMLQRRLRAAGTRLHTVLVADPPRIEAAPALDELLAGFTERERERLLAARYEPPAAATDGAQPRGFFAAAAARAMVPPDPRSREEYAAEIEAYLEQVRRDVRDAVTGDLKDHRPAHLALTLVNTGEQPFAGVEVTVIVQSPEVRCIDPNWETNSKNLDLPDPPKPCGTPPSSPPLIASFSHLQIPTPYRPHIPVLTNWEAEQRPEGVRISFDPIDLRAHARIVLEPVPLAIAPGTAGPLSVHWTAAGIDAAGQDSGTIALTVEPSTLPILSAAPDDLDAPADEAGHDDLEADPA